MSFYIEEFMRTDITFREGLEILEMVREAGYTGIGDFYHQALRHLNMRLPDIRTREDRENAEASAEIIFRGLAAERHGEAAQDLWHIIEFFNVLRDMNANTGIAMREALIALGQVQVGQTHFVPHVVRLLGDLNTRPIGDPETRRRVQRGVTGAVSALEAFGHIDGFRPIFDASVRGYDTEISNVARDALQNIVEDPADAIIAIIRDPSNNPPRKLRAWEEMLRSRAPDASMARAAAAALDVGWTFGTSNRIYQENLATMRKSAIDTIRDFGAADESVYFNLRRSYDRNFVSPAPDYIEILKTFDALAALGTDQAVGLLLTFLEELHGRRRVGPWTHRERFVMQQLIPRLASTGTQNPRVRSVLTTIQRSADYTAAEQGWARDALRALGH